MSEKPDEQEAKQEEIPEATQRPSRVEVLEFEKLRLQGKPCPLLSRIAGPEDDPVWQVMLCRAGCPFLVPHPMAERGRPVPKVCGFLALLDLAGAIVNNTGGILDKMGLREAANQAEKLWRPG